MLEAPLFCGGELRDYIAGFADALKDEVQAADESYLLNTDEEEWAAYLAEKFQIEVPTLRADDMYGEDEGETQVDVSYDRDNRSIDPSRPAYIAGRSFSIHIPYEGNRQLFSMRASTYSMAPPRAVVQPGELVLRWHFPHDRKPAVMTIARGTIAQVETHLEWQRGDVQSHNAGLLQQARSVISARRQRVMADHEFLGDIGIPVKRRGDAPSTYAAPGITRKPSPASGPPKPKPQAPVALEPTLVADLYEHICQVNRSMGHSMERTPDAYAKWDEERLRDALLVMLNSHYEGQAMGEVFQRAGKTDILVRIQDRNVFVGECKWWSGQSDYLKAIDQLFSYATWRDTKLALVVFVRAKELTAIIAKGRAALAEHEQFVAWDDAYEETELRAKMTWPGDDDRHATLTVFFFHLVES